MCENIFVAWHSINGICFAFAQRHNDDHERSRWTDVDGCGRMRSPDSSWFMDSYDYHFVVQFHVRHSTEMLRPC